MIPESRTLVGFYSFLTSVESGLRLRSHRRHLVSEIHFRPAFHTPTIYDLVGGTHGISILLNHHTIVIVILTVLAFPCPGRLLIGHWDIGGLREYGHVEAWQLTIPCLLLLDSERFNFHT